MAAAAAAAEKAALGSEPMIAACTDYCLPRPRIPFAVPTRSCLGQEVLLSWPSGAELVTDSRAAEATATVSARTADVSKLKPVAVCRVNRANFASFGQLGPRSFWEGNPREIEGRNRQIFATRRRRKIALRKLLINFNLSSKFDTSLQSSSSLIFLRLRTIVDLWCSIH